MISLGLVCSSTNVAVMLLSIIEFCRYVYIMDPVITLVLARVIICPLQAISLQSWFISVVSCALVICLICTQHPRACGPWVRVYISGKPLGYMIQLLLSCTQPIFLGHCESILQQIFGWLFGVKYLHLLGPYLCNTMVPYDNEGYNTWNKKKGII